MKVLQSRIWLLVGVIAALLFVGVLANPRFNFQSVPLEQLIVAIEEGRVQEIRVQNATTVTALLHDGTQIRTRKPADLNLLTLAQLDDDAPNKAFLYREDNNPLGQVLRAGALIILPLIAITTLYIFYIGRVNARRAKEAAS